MVAEPKSFAASTVVAACEFAWNAIREQAAKDLPPVVIVLAEGSTDGKWGHFAPLRWVLEDETERCEVFMAGERLQHGPSEVLETLIHEAAHAVAHARKIKDTSRQCRYHNGKFKAIAESLGLKVAKMGSIGWAETSIPPETVALYPEAIAQLKEAIRAFRRSEFSLRGVKVGTTAGLDADDGEKTSGKRDKLECGCGRSIRVSRSVAELGSITCGCCGQDFA